MYTFEQLFCSLCIRYSIDWKSDLDSYFGIDPVMGTISTNQLLDTESIAQHTISIVATKVSKYEYKSPVIHTQATLPLDSTPVVRKTHFRWIQFGLFMKSNSSQYISDQGHHLFIIFDFSQKGEMHTQSHIAHTHTRTHTHANTLSLCFQVGLHVLLLNSTVLLIGQFKAINTFDNDILITRLGNSVLYSSCRMLYKLPFCKNSMLLPNEVYL